MSYSTARLDELATQQGMIPIRKRFGIGAFGVNAWRADAEGGTVIAEHDEKQSGHQELYTVVSGHATFTVGGEEIDAPAGALVAITDPAVTRKAVARDAGTTVLAIGAPAGAVFEPQAWEWNAEALPLFAARDYEGARATLLRGLALNTDAAGILYNLACAESRLGDLDAAHDYLARAIAGAERFAEFADTDDDLEALRADPRWETLRATGTS
jgi:quercetin dioxygenase-like cupin family protein